MTLQYPVLNTSKGLSITPKLLKEKVLRMVRVVLETFLLAFGYLLSLLLLSQIWACYSTILFMEMVSKNHWHLNKVLYGLF
jgi:hypothetical protein